MATARNIVKKALQKVGVITKDEEPSADETQDGVDTLNALIDSWSNESLMVYASAWETFTINSGDAEYTIGTGGDFNTTRPLFISAAYVRQGNTDYALGRMSDINYNNDIITKNTLGIPEFYNFDNGFPLAKIRLYPVPSIGLSLFLLSQKKLSDFDIDDEVELPPGWERAIINNLAVDIAAEYGQEIPESTAAIAKSSLANIKISVAKNKTADCPALVDAGSFEIRSARYI